MIVFGRYNVIIYVKKLLKKVILTTLSYESEITGMIFYLV